MAEQEVRYLGDVQRLTLGPDDIVVLKTSLVLSAAQASMIESMVSAKIGTDHRVLVLSSGVEIGVLTPLDAPARPQRSIP